MWAKLIKAHVGHARSLAQQAACWHQGLLLRATLTRRRLIDRLVPRSAGLQLLGFLSDHEVKTHALIRFIRVLTLEEFAPVVRVLQL
jgi:hypothetical protein